MCMGLSLNRNVTLDKASMLTLPETLNWDQSVSPWLPCYVNSPASCSTPQGTVSIMMNACFLTMPSMMTLVSCLTRWVSSMYMYPNFPWHKNIFYGILHSGSFFKSVCCHQIIEQLFCLRPWCCISPDRLLFISMRQLVAFSLHVSYSPYVYSLQTHGRNNILVSDISSLFYSPLLNVLSWSWGYTKRWHKL